MQYVRAIRKGLIKFDEPKEEEPKFYLLWGDDSSAAEKANHLAYIPAPKPKLPGLIYIHLALDFNIACMKFSENFKSFAGRP